MKRGPAVSRRAPVAIHKSPPRTHQHAPEASAPGFRFFISGCIGRSICDAGDGFFSRAFLFGGLLAGPVAVMLFFRHGQLADFFLS